MKHLHCYFWNLQIGWGLNVGRGDSCLWGDFRNPRKMSLVKVGCLPLDTAFVFCGVVFLVDCLNFPLYNWEINYFCIIEQLNQILFTALGLSAKQLLHQNFPTCKWVRLICEGFRANSTIWLVLMLTQSKKSHWTSAFSSAHKHKHRHIISYLFMQAVLPGWSASTQGDVLSICTNG